MADAKISALPASTTPLAGTEVLPVVQSGATKQVSVANLTAGRAVAGLSFTGTNDSSFNGVTVGKGAGGGSGNTIAGNGALAASAGNLNVAIGYQAGARVTGGNSNVFIGHRAGDSANSFAGCTFIGDRIGLLNQANDNCAVGVSALESVTTGGYNVAFGSAYYGVSSGPLGSLTTGNFNTAIGNQAGLNLTTGSNNGFFGYNAQPSAVGVSNEYTYGNSSVTVHRFYGNLTPLGAAKGINFTANTPAAGMTSQLLNWYEEGTWTPADASGAGLSLTATGTYTRIGRMVMAQFSISYPSTASTANAVISGLPFGVALDGGYAHTYTSSNTAPITNRFGGAGSTSFAFLNYNFSTNITNNQLSGTNTQGTYIYFI